MHPLYARAASLTSQVIAAAIEVHRRKGPGLLESIYEWCLMRELDLRRINAANQRTVRVEYKGFVKDEPMRFDLLVEDCLLIETKVVERVIPIHRAQLLSYMRLIDVPLGLLINFNMQKLTDGVSRVILPGADR